MNNDIDYKEEYLKLKKKAYETVTSWQVRNPERVLYHAAKQRALKQGKEFTISIEDIVIPDTCPILGIKLEFTRDFGKKNRTKSSPSLDRLDSTKGYIPGNIRVISDIANKMKSNATQEELLLFAEAILQGKV